MSVLTRKQPVNDVSGIKGHTARAARQVGPLASQAVPLAQQAAQQAVPLARSAGDSVRQGADSAVAWATPIVDSARSWAAPQLEQSAYTINENLAPRISAALIAAARKIDAPQRKPRRRPVAVLAGTALLTAAAGAGAAAILARRRSNGDGYAIPVAGEDLPAGGQPVAGGTYLADDQADLDADGHPRIV